MRSRARVAQSSRSIVEAMLATLPGCQHEIIDFVIAKRSPRGHWVSTQSQPRILLGSISSWPSCRALPFGSRLGSASSGDRSAQDVRPESPPSPPLPSPACGTEAVTTTWPGRDRPIPKSSLPMSRIYPPVQDGRRPGGSAQAPHGPTPVTILIPRQAIQAADSLPARTDGTRCPNLDRHRRAGCCS